MATRKVSGEKTCLPTDIISDVARVLIVKPFGYSQKQCEMGFIRGVRAAQRVGLRDGIEPLTGTGLVCNYKKSYIRE